MKRFKYQKSKNKYSMLLLFIIILTLINLIFINTKITPKFIDIASKSIEIYNNKLIMSFISNETLSNLDLNNLIELIKNDNEIYAVNYDTKSSYKVLKIITDELNNIVSNTTYSDILDFKYDIKDSLIIYYPITLAFNYAYLNNIGPKIPVKIKYLSSLVTTLKTKVSNYGINNVLIEIYVSINIIDDIVIPLKKESINKEYEVLLTSKIVMGNVPTYLGGTITNSSPILQN